MTNKKMYIQPMIYTNLIMVGVGQLMESSTDPSKSIHTENPKVEAPLRNFVH